MKLDKEKLRQKYMAKIEEETLRLGIPYEIIHGKEHEQFWNGAQYYFTQLIPPLEAAQKLYESWKNNYKV